MGKYSYRKNIQCKSQGHTIKPGTLDYGTPTRQQNTGETLMEH